MSVDLELWTREEGDIAPLLPRADQWDSFDGEFQFDGGEWVVSVFSPEPVPASEVPPEVASLTDGLAYRVELGVEPSDASTEAWTLVREVLMSVGRELRGAGLDPESGRPTSWSR